LIQFHDLSRAGILPFELGFNGLFSQWPNCFTSFERSLQTCSLIGNSFDTNTVIAISLLAGILITFGGLKSKLDVSIPKIDESLFRIFFKSVQIIGMLLLIASVVLNEVKGDLSEGMVIPILTALLGALISKIIITLFDYSRPRGCGLRDISEMDNLFSSMSAFNPLTYVDVSQGVFVGLQSPQSLAVKKCDQHLGKPLYVPWLLFKETHAQILGSTGSGKGIALGVLGYQFALNKESLIVFDPKGDARLPLVLNQGALRSGSAFIYLDLQAHAKPQFNLLEGANEFEIEELLVGGLGLQPSSGDANYYRGIDQDAAEQVSKIAIQSAFTDPVSLPRLLEIAQFHKQLSKADNFVRRLRQICELRVIQTTHGIGLLEHIQQGSVIYIRGSTDNHRVKMLQTMLLIRILQVVKTRASLKVAPISSPLKPVCLILDEFKHLLSPVALDMLGVVRELGCHALLAHQSLADLAGCPGLDRKDVEPVVIDNATLKLIFRIGDDQAAKGFANKSGQERTYKESFKPAVGSLEIEKSWSEVQHPRMSADLFLHLHRPSEAPQPFTAGVLYGLGLAKLFSLSPIAVKGELAPPKEAPLHSRTPVLKEEELI